MRTQFSTHYHHATIEFNFSAAATSTHCYIFFCSFAKHTRTRHHTLTRSHIRIEWEVEEEREREVSRNVKVWEHGETTTKQQKYTLAHYGVCALLCVAFVCTYALKPIHCLKCMTMVYTFFSSAFSFRLSLSLSDRYVCSRTLQKRLTVDSCASRERIVERSIHSPHSGFCDERVYFNGYDRS